MHVVPLEAFDQRIAQPCQVGKHFDKGETFNAGLSWICRHPSSAASSRTPVQSRVLIASRGPAFGVAV
jgi:hypothetical protein